MTQSEDRKHYIVKHDLMSLLQLPNFIWRSDMTPDTIPRGFKQVKLGDRWIGFAYTSSDLREKPLSQVTGFFECVTEACYRKVPRQKENAWMIEGKEHGEQPHQPIGIPPIDTVLGRKTFNRATLIPITSDEYEYVRKYSIARELNPECIPLLQREPKYEQELVAIVANGHKRFGIEKIIKVGTAFPDLLVKIEGCPEEVHLELEILSSGFFLHEHEKQVRKGKFLGDGKPVAVLCWIDDDPRVKEHVHKVFELQTLLRDVKKIVW